MDNPTKHSSIADPSVPNAGRIYDYLLGGHHNFEVDRIQAENLLKIVPFMGQTLRLIRWFLGEATVRLLDQGHEKFLDFASGLPATDHIHQLAREGVKVIYSDIDPITVEYGREILGGNPWVKYVQCDVGKPEELLESPLVREHFGESRKVAIGMNGIAYFLTDEQLSRSLKMLYDWAEEGSHLFVSDADADSSETKANLEPVFDLYASIGQPLYIRKKEKLVEMAKPWVVEEPGLLPLNEWLGLGREVKEKEMTEWGGGGFYGVILKK